VGVKFKPDLITLPYAPPIKGGELFIWQTATLCDNMNFKKPSFSQKLGFYYPKMKGARQ
jgi:hypothetical protein